MEDRIQRDITIAAPIDRVWAALTQPQHVGLWFGTGKPAKIDFQPGGAIVFDGGYGESLATIERIEPPHLFSYRWAQVGPENVPPHEGNATLVEFALTSHEDGTLLTVTETGFATLTDVDLAGRERQYKENAGGWPQVLAALADYVAGLPA